MSGPIKFDPPQPVDLTALLQGYEVHDLVATGGMGAVYRATHVSLDRTVAIKVLPSEFADESFHEQFQAEARAMAKLNHPNLIGIYDFGTTSTGLPFIVMEFVAGKSLYYSAYQKAIEEKTAVRITKEICDGLAQAHRNNIIHRDIKPANILMDPDAHAKIGDFGLASHADSGPQHASDDVVYGTPGYAAPEIIHNPAAIGKPSDIFAVGVILYELLTGHLPDAHNPKPPSRIANTDPRLDRVIRKATHSNPAMRYQDAGEMSEDLEKITTNPQGGASARPTSRIRKRSGSVHVKAGGAMSKSGRILSNGEKAPPILSKPKKITGKIPAKVSKDYHENSDLGQERRVSPRRSRPKDYTGPQISDRTAPVRSTVTPMQSGGGGSSVRNIVIIAILAPALYFLWGMYQKKQSDIAEQKDRIRIEQEAEKQKRNRALKVPSSGVNTPLQGNRPSGKSSPANSDGRRTGNNSAQNNPATKAVQIFGDTPMEQLAELKQSLANGARVTMPDDVISRGTKFLLPITKEMTWSQAAHFAEEHGGYLATPSTLAELEWFSNNLPAGMDKIWLGGGAQGKTDWGWVTGEEWRFRKPSTELGSCALLTSSGTIKARPNVSEFPFFIEWTKDGTNPGNLASQLVRLKNTLNSPNPKWLPGTIAFQTRHYYFVQRPAAWEDADLIAGSGGGHLAVCSNRVESSYLNDILQEILKPGQSVWLGGLKDSNEWAWSTDEPFVYPQWIAGAPNGSTSDTGIRFVCQGNKSGWDDANPYDSRSVNGFLIEWSNDGKSPTVTNRPSNKRTSSSSEIERLRKLGRKKLNEYLSEHRQVLNKGAKSLEGAMVRWFDKLPKSEKDQNRNRVEEYKSAILKARKVPTNLSRSGMPSRIRQLYDGSIESQNRFEKALNTKILNLRNGYLNKILDAKEKAQKQGKVQEVKKLDEEIKKIGQSTTSFRKHLGI